MHTTVLSARMGGDEGQRRVFAVKKKKVEQTFSPFSSKSNCKQNTKRSENVDIVSLVFFFFRECLSHGSLCPGKPNSIKQEKKKAAKGRISIVRQSAY